MSTGVALGRSRWGLAFLAAFAGIGAWLGYTIGSGWGSTGLTAFFSAAIALGLAIIIVLVLIVVAALVGWKSDNRISAMRPMIRVGVFFLAAIGIGWALSRVFAPL